MSWLDDLATSVLTRARPGRALAMVARTTVPIFRPDRFALRMPEPGVAAATTSPLVEDCAPRPVTPGVLDGDVVIKDQIDVAGLRTGVGVREGGEVAERDATIVARIAAA